jgi:hypothetical protein
MDLPLLVLNLRLHVIDRIRGLDLERDGLASESLDENLHDLECGVWLYGLERARAAPGLIYTACRSLNMGVESASEASVGESSCDAQHWNVLESTASNSLDCFGGPQNISNSNCEYKAILRVLRSRTPG